MFPGDHTAHRAVKGFRSHPTLTSDAGWGIPQPAHSPQQGQIWGTKTVSVAEYFVFS